VVLLAARLTALYHWANASNRAAMSRWDDDVATVDASRANRSRELQGVDEHLLDPIR
jgi:hypothetical protein